MTTHPKHSLPPVEANKLLKDGLPLTDLKVDGYLFIESLDNWDKEVVIENCSIENFSSISMVYNKPVKLLNCHFKNALFHFERLEEMDRLGSE